MVSVDSAQRAEGILGVSDFDLTLVGYGATDDSGGPYFDHWLRDPSYAHRPFLILSDTDTPALGIPQELVIPPHASPANVLGAVALKLTGAVTDEPVFNGATNDQVDDMLDAALGLDQIEVKNSETMSSETSKISSKKKSESLVGYEAEVTSVNSTQSNITDTAKIDLALAMNKGTGQRTGAPKLPEEDQLNLASHKFAAQQTSPKSAQPAEMMREDLTAAKSTPTANENVFEWDSGAADPAELSKVFSRELAQEIAERVAAKLVGQLNSEKFIQLVQAEIENYLKRKS